MIGMNNNSIYRLLERLYRNEEDKLSSDDYNELINYVIEKANKHSSRQYEVIEITKAKEKIDQKYFDVSAYLCGIKRRKHYYDPLTDDEFMAIWKLHNRDYSNNNIANIFEISRNTVTKVLRNEEKYKTLKKRELWQDDETLQKLKAHGFVE